MAGLCHKCAFRSALWSIAPPDLRGAVTFLFCSHSFQRFPLRFSPFLYLFVPLTNDGKPISNRAFVGTYIYTSDI